MSDTKTSGHKGGLTIADAIANYKARAANPTHCLIDMAGEVIKEGATLKLKNDCYPDALEYTETMLFHTKESINILTGGGCGGFYATLIQPVTNALERIKAASGSARMIVVSNAIPEWLAVLAQEFRGTFELAQMETSSPISHFIVCDSKIVRAEEPHGELTADTLADTIKAEVIFNEPNKGKELEGRFVELWRQSTVVEIDSERPAAPSWLIQRMEALRKMPPPTSQKMRAQWAASMEFSQKSGSKDSVY